MITNYWNIVIVATLLSSMLCGRISLLSSSGLAWYGVFNNNISFVNICADICLYSYILCFSIIQLHDFHGIRRFVGIGKMENRTHFNGPHKDRNTDNAYDSINMYHHLVDDENDKRKKWGESESFDKRQNEWYCGQLWANRQTKWSILWLNVIGIFWLCLNFCSTTNNKRTINIDTHKFIYCFLLCNSSTNDLKESMIFKGADIFHS